MYKFEEYLEQVQTTRIYQENWIQNIIDIVKDKFKDYALKALQAIEQTGNQNKFMSVLNTPLSFDEIKAKVAQVEQPVTEAKETHKAFGKMLTFDTLTAGFVGGFITFLMETINLLTFDPANLAKLAVGLIIALTSAGIRFYSMDHPTWRKANPDEYNRERTKINTRDLSVQDIYGRSDSTTG